MIGHELIIWNDDLVTGIIEMDEQHRILINSINEANTRLTSNVNAEILDQITQDLLSYALYHFETEEALMQIHHYTDKQQEDANTHIQQHREFSSTVLSIREGLKVGHLISREELLTFLNNWMIDHILSTDKQLGAFILAKRAELAS
ncbi:MAG: bacteriohemerythrin [Gallionella sp.]|nr:bacteriohemerythrin [Gallionella sp.]